MLPQKRNKMKIVNNYEELEALQGQEIGMSDYEMVTQDKINKFAEATNDFQWIHIDEERAKKESPFGTTIAHGYLTVSMITNFWYQVIEVQNVKLIVNYGIEALRFVEPVLVNDKIRARFVMKKVQNLRGVAKAEVEAVIEIDGKAKPALKAVFIFLYHFA